MVIKRVFLLISVLAVISAVSGCAKPVTKRVEVEGVAAEIEAKKQREIALEAWFADEQRLNNIAYRILKRSVPLCGEKVRNSIGVSYANKYMLPEDMQEAGFSLYGITDVIKIIHVIEGSAAAEAGIKRDDIPVAINDWSVPVGEGADKKFREKLSEAMNEGSEISIKVLRNGTVHEFSFQPDSICDYTVVLSKKDIVNAYADGRRIIVARGMLRFAKDDTELALVVSHELAHNVMGHIDAKMRNYVLGSIFDIIAAVYGVNTQGVFGEVAARAYSKEFEAEADYVGLYMMALAGLDYENAPRFWRRMAAIHPGSIKTNHMATHPATPYRFVALEKTIEEIRRKISSGLPLRPEMKQDGD